MMVTRAVGEGRVLLWHVAPDNKWNAVAAESTRVIAGVRNGHGISVSCLHPHVISGILSSRVQRFPKNRTKTVKNRSKNRWKPFEIFKQNRVSFVKNTKIFLFLLKGNYVFFFENL